VTEATRFTSVEFRNFKAFQTFSVRLAAMNVMVGPNNCGKSTVIGAFRALAVGLRRAASRSADLVTVGGGARRGHILAEDAIPISLENVHTDYSEEDTYVLFHLSNGNALRLLFPRDRGVFLLPETPGHVPRTPSQFRAAFPVSVAVVPVLGPVEHDEDLVQEETVRRELSTHRASRHFRSYWHYFGEGFDEFADLVRKTWPDMDILPPERPDYLARKISMFCLENRISRELFWSGFGFQIWCQLLTHIARSKNDTLIVVDEPEIYLHPDVQRQLLDVLGEAWPDVLLATHSAEVIAEADPSEILLIDKAAHSAKRLADAAGVQQALDVVGSAHNIALTRLARDRRVVFVENDTDFAIIRRFAKVLGFPELATGSGLTPLRSEGFGSWERIGSVGWGIERTLGSPLRIAVVYDRDFFPDEQIEAMVQSLSQHIPLVHVHARKEIENYLLSPFVVQRALERVVRDRCRRDGHAMPELRPAEELLDAVSDNLRTSVTSQYAARRAEFLRSSGVDQATVYQQVADRIERLWGDIDQRMTVVPGKTVLAALRSTVRELYSVNLSERALVDAHTAANVPEDLRDLIQRMEAFRNSR